MIDSQDLMILQEISFRRQRNINELTNKLKLTRRQLTYAISKLNGVLTDNHQETIEIMGDKLHIVSDAECFLQNTLFENIFMDDLYYTKKSRILMMIILLSCEMDYLPLSYFMVMLKSSRSTVLLVLKEVRHAIKDTTIEVRYTRKRGYHFVGNEEDIRYFIMRTIINNLQEDHGDVFIENFVNKIFPFSYTDIEAKVLDICRIYNVYFLENKLKEFTFCFVILSLRLKKFEVETDYWQENMNGLSLEYQFSEQVCRIFDITNRQSIDYVNGWILGLSIGNIIRQTNDRGLIKTLVSRIVLRLESLAGVVFEDKKVAIKQLYEHFRPAYYRMLYRLPIVNPLTEKIRKEYSELYYLCNEALSPLQPLFSKEIPDDEIAFLTMHFASLVLNGKETHIKKHQCVIYCPNGIGISAILLRELEILFPNIEFITLRNLKGIDAARYDILFTTTITADILSVNLPFVVVNPIMTAKEKIDIIRLVFGIIEDESLFDTKTRAVMDVVKEFVSEMQYQLILSELLLNSSISHSYIISEEGSELPLLSDITSKELIKLDVVADDWEEAIRNSTSILVEQGKVKASYIDGMVQSTKETGPYIVITKHVALPHARPECGAIDIAISIAKLKTPVNFGNQENDPVKYVFGLSALDNQTHLTAMAELAELLDQPDFYQTLDTANTSEEVYEFIKNFERRMS